MAPSKKMKESKPEETLTRPLEENEEDEEKEREALEEGEDRLSNLPNSLLVHILSLLDSTEDAIKTGTLSKRWKSVWTAVPKLIFDQYSSDRRPTSELVSLVNKTLDQRRSCKDKLKIFNVKIIHDNAFDSDVKSWISFAVKRKVEELELMMLSNHKFRLPKRIFRNSSFSRLGLGGCVLKPKRQISWKNLRDLCISSALLDGTLIQNILSGSPLLETLVLDGCEGYHQLNITSKSLKVLSVIGYGNPFARNDGIEINAPNILSLEIGGDLRSQKPSLQNVSAIVDAKLDYKLCGRKEVEEKLLKDLIQSLSHVMNLEVGVLCSKAVSRLKDKGFTFPSNVKFPVVTSPLDSDSDPLEYWD